MSAVPVPAERHRISHAELLCLAQPARLLDLSAGRLHGGGGGVHLSRFRGRGMEYDESRPYAPGDDVRHLDWRVTARTGRAHTKVFCEETERPVLIWLDLRASMRFASRGYYKAVQAVRAAALLAWAAWQHGDRIGCIAFGDTSHHELRPRRGQAALLRLLRYWAGAWDVEASVPGSAAGTDSAGAALARLARVVRPGSLLFLAGDFRGLSRADEARLGELSRHSELLAMLCYDPLEQRLPPPGTYCMSDGLREVELVAGGAEMARRYRMRFERRRDRLRRILLRGGGRLLECATQHDPVAILQQALRGRRR